MPRQSDAETSGVNMSFSRDGGGGSLALRCATEGLSYGLELLVCCFVAGVLVCARKG